MIGKLKALFAMHGHWSFVHVTSSPTYPQINGKVEAAVKSAKTVMYKTKKAKTRSLCQFLDVMHGRLGSPNTRVHARLFTFKTNDHFVVVRCCLLIETTPALCPTI